MLQNCPDVRMSLAQSLESPSDHLLRTLAAVPVSSHVLDLGCGEGLHTEAFLRLGFPVHACDPRPEAVRTTRSKVRPLLEEDTAETCVQETSLKTIDYPDATFDWVVAYRPEIFVEATEDLTVLFEQSRRLLKPGGWLYVTVPAPPGDEGANSMEDSAPGPRFSIETVEAQRKDANLVEASQATRVQDHGEPRVRAIYRRVEPHTPG